jgi:hypothetical protein
MIFALLKFVAVMTLLLGGAFFLATGLGVEISLLKYKELEVYGIPIGVALLITGVALARFWKVRRTEYAEETVTYSAADGSSTTTRKETETTTTFTPPRM